MLAPSYKIHAYKAFCSVARGHLHAGIGAAGAPAGAPHPTSGRPARRRMANSKYEYVKQYEQDLSLLPGEENQLLLVKAAAMRATNALGTMHAPPSRRLRQPVYGSAWLNALGLVRWHVRASAHMNTYSLLRRLLHRRAGGWQGVYKVRPPGSSWVLLDLLHCCWTSGAEDTKRCMGVLGLQCVRVNFRRRAA